MSKYWNNRTRNITPYVPGEQPKDRKFIKLNTNENPYPPSPKVIEAIKNTANSDLRLYPDPTCTALRETIAARFGYKKENVFAGNGSDEILGFAFGAFFESRQNSDSQNVGILFPDISYSFYPVYANLWDNPFRTIPLSNDFSINCNDYKQPSGGAVIPNPNAPTGMSLPLADILSLADYLESQNRVLILDEAYAAYGTESAIPHIGNHPSLLTVHTLSKSASLAGLRVGFAIGSEELIDGLFRIHDSFNSYTMDRLALAGGIAAINDPGYYDNINRKVMATRERTVQALSGLGFSQLPSAANFIFVKASNIGGGDLYTALREKGILVRHFNKPRISDYIRISIGTDEDMDVFIKACTEIVNR